MPLINLRCPNGHRDEQYLHSWAQRYQLPSRWCACGHPMHAQASFGTPLLYFSESNPRYIWTLDRTVKSHGEHVRTMKELGVEPATEWHASRSLSDGLPTKARKPHPREKLTRSV